MMRLCLSQSFVATTSSTLYPLACLEEAIANDSPLMSASLQLQLPVTEPDPVPVPSLQQRVITTSMHPSPLLALQYLGVVSGACFFFCPLSLLWQLSITYSSSLPSTSTHCQCPPASEAAAAVTVVELEVLRLLINSLLIATLNLPQQ